jgi:hypothetical protein
MKGTSLIVLAAGLLLSSTQALQLVRRDAHPAVIGLDIQRRNVGHPVKRDLQRRAGTVSEILANEVSFSPPHLQWADSIFAGNVVLRQRQHWNSAAELPVANRHRQQRSMDGGSVVKTVSKPERNL